MIQGPPGTGKSTTIYHILDQYVPLNKCALVSCVSNKAIDAIAEKFVKCNICFIVVGKDDRVGSTAKQWTLKAQIDRHVDIVQLRKVKHFLLQIENKLNAYKDDKDKNKEK